MASYSKMNVRAGARRVSFRLDQADAADLRGLPAVDSLEIRHDLVQIRTADSDLILYALLDAGYRPRDIEVSALGLEQAFLAITAEDNLQTPAPAGAGYQAAGEAVR